MKKLLLLITATLMAFSGFAQTEGQETETPKNPTSEPGWWITVSCADPSGIPDAYYKMDATDSKKGEQTVYSKTFTVNVYPEQTKSTKYQYTVTYTSEESVQTTTQTAWYTQAISDGNVEVTAAAWLDSKNNVVTTNSVSPYLVCGGGGYTGYCYFTPVNKGVSATATQYFNLASGYKVNEIRPGINAQGNYYVGSNGTSIKANVIDEGTTLPNANDDGIGIYTATMDYTTSSMTFEKSNTISLFIDNAMPFVAPIEMSFPEGIELYEFGSIDGSSLNVTLSESQTIPANTPVILKAAKPGQYIFAVSGENYSYSTATTGSHTYINDVSSENASEFKGVMQPHWASVNSYVFNGTEFVKVTTTNSVLVNPFTCYLQLEENATEIITIEFPEEEQPEEPAEDVIYVHFTDNTGIYSSTHSMTLVKNEDGYYTNDASFDFGSNAYFVLADAKFADEPVEEITIMTLYNASRNWSELGDATIYSLSDEVAHSDEEDATENKITTWENIKVSTASDTESVNPFEVTPGKVFAISFNPADTDNMVLTVTDNGLSGIFNVTISEETSSDNRIFNVYGQEVDETYKGIVIKNGKKLILR